VAQVKSQIEAHSTAIPSEDPSQKELIKGGSLSTILQQALMSEDADQLDWLLLSSAHADPLLIEKTVYQIKDQHTIHLLIKKILEKF
jgi:hypothetical protein